MNLDCSKVICLPRVLTRGRGEPVVGGGTTFLNSYLLNFVRISSGSENCPDARLSKVLDILDELEL